MTEVLVGIDAGTSGVKVTAFTPDGTLLHKEQRPASVSHPALDRAELDLNLYWESICDALRSTCTRFPGIVGVGIAATTPTTILFDKNLNPLGNGILYMDNRASGALQEVENIYGGRGAYFHRMGNRLSVSTCAAVNIKWVQQNEPERWNRTSHTGYLNSFITGRLTGQAAVDFTTASYSGLYPLADCSTDWDSGLLEHFGLDKGKMLPLIAAGEMVGRVKAEAAACTGLPEGTPVAAGSADTAAAAFALGQKESGDTFESAGTSGVVTFVLDRPRFNTAFMNRRHIIDGRWLAHGAMSMSGGSLFWAISNVWPELKSVENLEKEAAKSPPGSNGILFLPYLAGERSPVWNPDACGNWFGLTRNSRREDMIRAIFEASAYAMRQLMDEAERSWKWRPSALVGVGGGVKSRLWNSIKADTLNVEYTPSNNSDAAALGAALMGGTAAELFRGTADPSIPQMSKGLPPVTPNTGNIEIYSKMYQIYSSLYPRLESSMRTLAGLRRRQE